MKRDTKPKTCKTCRVCKDKFLPFQPLQKVCSGDCAQAWADRVRIKREAAEKANERKAALAARKELRQRKSALKTRRDWLREAQAAFNAYIRARDAGKPCICCGLPLSAGDVGGKFDCGHYRSIGSAPHLRFQEANAHGQRKKCNRWGVGRAVDYRKGLIERIGLAAVEAIEADQAPRHYSVDDLQEIKRTYTAKRRELEKA